MKQSIRVNMQATWQNTWRKPDAQPIDMAVLVRLVYVLVRYIDTMRQPAPWIYSKYVHCTLVVVH